MALSVGFTMFVKVIANVEHPPACGTSLGVDVDGFSGDIVLTILISSILLAAAHYFFNTYMKDLV